MKRWKVVVALILATATLIVVLQNTEPVETQLLFTSVTMPRALLLAITLLVGFALGLALSGRLVARDGKAKPGKPNPKKTLRTDGNAIG